MSSGDAVALREIVIWLDVSLDVRALRAATTSCSYFKLRKLWPKGVQGIALNESDSGL